MLKLSMRHFFLTALLVIFALSVIMSVRQCASAPSPETTTVTTVTTTQVPPESIDQTPAILHYFDAAGGKPSGQKPLVIRVPVFIHDTIIDSVYVPTECQHCRFQAVSDTVQFPHGDKIVATFSYPGSTFGFPYFQPAPDTTITTVKTVVIPPDKLKFSPQAGAGAIMGLDGVLRAGIYIGFGVSYSF